MFHSLRRELILHIPLASSPVQALHFPGRRFQPFAQQIGEKTMVAIPLAAIVQGHNEEVGSLQNL